MLKYVLRVYPAGQSRVASRTLEVPGSYTLDQLCGLILVAFEFDDDHLYEFCMDNRPYSDNSYRFSPYPDESTTGIPLVALGLVKGQNFSLHYDFGDDWMFTIHVNRTDEVSGDVTARVTASKGTVEQYPDWEDEDDVW